ncbi:MAG: hypothetical protein N2D54_11675, partial [Chloroflexota bacterium]
IRNVPSFSNLLYGILFLSIVHTIMEYHFLAVTDPIYPTQGEYQIFYSYYRLAITLLVLLLQIFITKEILEQMKIKNSFLLLPITATAVVIGLILVPGAGVIITGLIVFYLVRETVTRPSRKAFQDLVPKEKRGGIATYLGRYFPYAGTMLGALFTGAVVVISSNSSVPAEKIYLSIALLCTILGLWNIFRMRAVYDASLMNFRFSRQHNKKDTMNTVLLDRISD